jgi:acyl carrier protein
VKESVFDYLKKYFENIGIVILDDKDFLKFNYLESDRIDSFEIIQLIVGIESEFKILIEANDTESDEFRTIGGLIKIIENQV